MRAKNKLSVLTVFFILIIALVVYKSLDAKEVCVEDKICFDVEIADDSLEISKGLSVKESIENDEGMLFIFEREQTPGFWMKDMNFPIDLLWVNSDMKIIGIEKNMQPCTPNSCPLFYPNETIKYVLEINSGVADLYDLEVGDGVKF